MTAAAVLGAWIALITPARAEAPLPDWREELVVGTWVAFDEAILAACDWPQGRGGPPADCDVARLDRVIADARAFLAQVVDDPRLRYLVGLAHRYAGRTQEAVAELEVVVARAPDRAEAWSDLGELLLLRGDSAGAARAAREVIRLRAQGDANWLGWLQLAQAEGWRGDPAAFEAALAEALRRGLPPAMLAGQPTWRRFWQDHRLRPPLDRLLRLHGADDVLTTLSTP